MALSAAEQQEMNQLESEVGGAAPSAQGSSLSPDEQTEMSQLENEVGHAAPSAQSATPEDDGGLLGKAYRGFHKLASESNSTVLNGIDLANQAAGAISKYGGNFIRSTLLGENNSGNALSGDEYLQSKGVPKGPSATLPTKTLIGHNIELSPRAAAGAAIDMATDPLTYLLAGTGKVGEAIEATPDIAQGVAKKGVRVFAGTPEETTARYLQNPESVRGAAGTRDISDRLTALSDQTKSSVDSAKNDFDTAKEQLRTANQAADAAEQKAGNEFQDERYNASQALGSAKDKFSAASQKLRESLQAHNLTSFAGEVGQSVDDLKNQVVQGSNDAYDILGKSSAKVNVDPIVDQMQSAIKSMRINGEYESPQAEQAAGELRDWQMRLFKMTKGTGGNLTGPQSKQLMQALDGITNYSNAAGEFTPQTEAALKGMRAQIDQSVKAQVPEYADKMADVSQKTHLLNQARNLYGTPEKAISNLNNLTTQKGEAIHVPILKALSDATGRDLRGPVADYINAKHVLKSPSAFDDLMGGTSEGQELSQREAEMSKITDPEYKRQKLASARASQADNIASAENALSEKESMLNEAQRKNALFKGINPNTVTRRQWALNNPGSEYGAEKQFQAIDKEFGTNFENEIRSRNDADAFSKDHTRGSRMAVILGALGGGAGMLTGSPEVAGMLAAGGTAAGGIADKYAGPMARWMLDQGMEVGPYVRMAGKDLQSVPLSAKAADAAILNFPGSSAAASTARAADNKRQSMPSKDIAPAAPTKGPAKWANDGLQNLIQHSGDQSLASLKDNPKAKSLLITASDLKPGTKAMAQVLSKLKSQMGGKK